MELTLTSVVPIDKLKYVNPNRLKVCPNSYPIIPNAI
jgi:hypothetical protein